MLTKLKSLFLVETCIFCFQWFFVGFGLYGYGSGSGTSPIFYTDPEPGKIYESGGSGSRAGQFRIILQDEASKHRKFLDPKSYLDQTKLHPPYRLQLTIFLFLITV